MPTMVKVINVEDAVQTILNLRTFAEVLLNPDVNLASDETSSNVGAMIMREVNGLDKWLGQVYPILTKAEEKGQ